MDDKPIQEQTEAEHRSSPSGKVVYRAIFMEACDELERPSSALFYSGLAAGFSMGASLITEGLIASLVPNALWKPLITKVGYSAGFLIVILGRQQLFTENTLTPMLPLLHEKTWDRLKGVARLWAVVLVANLLGCLAAAWFASSPLAFDPPVKAQFSDIARQAMTGSFASHFVHAVLAGWLIALMVWMLPFAETARIWVVIAVSYLIGLGHFSHIVAGSVQTFYGALQGDASWGDVLGRYLLPTLLGNIVGGVALVAAVNHAQVKSGS